MERKLIITYNVIEDIVSLENEGDFSYIELHGVLGMAKMIIQDDYLKIED